MQKLKIIAAIVGNIATIVNTTNAYAELPAQGTDPATVAYQMGEHAKALVQYEAALRYFADAVRFAPDNIYYVTALGTMFQMLGRYSEAAQQLERALSLAERGDDQHRLATAINNLAMLYDAQGKNDQAEPLYQQAIAIFEAKFGADHPNTKTVQANYQDFLAARAAAR